MNRRVDVNTSILFHLLRVAIGTERVEIQKVEGVVWQSVYALARKQGVLAIAFDGLSQLFEADKEFAKAFPQSLKLQWINAVFNIESRYEYSRTISAEIAEKWAEQNIKTLCLKGLSFSTYYPIPSHRECGDFDCYLMGDFERGDRIAEQLGAKVRFDDYKHSHINYKGLMIENHKFCTPIRGPKINKRFEREIQQLLDENDGLTLLDGGAIYSPSPTFNTIFLIKHSMVHFLYEGIKVRHILDWVCLVKHEGKNIDWSFVNYWCRLLHLVTFVDLMNAMANRYFGLELSYIGVAPDDKLVDRFVRSLLYDDTSVYNNTYPSIWHQRYEIAKNMLASRWKFRDVYNKSLILELMKSSIYAIFEKHPKL